MKILMSLPTPSTTASADVNDDFYYTQVLLNCSDALFIAGKAALESDVLLDVVWQQPNENKRRNEPRCCQVSSCCLIMI